MSQLKRKLATPLAASLLAISAGMETACHRLEDDPNISPKHAEELPLAKQELEDACNAWKQGCTQFGCPDESHPLSTELAKKQETIREIGHEHAKKFTNSPWFSAVVKCPESPNQKPNFGVWIFGLTKDQFEEFLR
jgi:hypothetical protein